MEKAYGLIADCQNYLVFSTGPTADCLQESLKWIKGIAPILEVTEGNTTSRSRHFIEANRFHSVVATVLRWL
jgi:hypothetical protein